MGTDAAGGDCRCMEATYLSAKQTGVLQSLYKMYSGHCCPKHKLEAGSGSISSRK